MVRPPYQCVNTDLQNPTARRSWASGTSNGWPQRMTSKRPQSEPSIPRGRVAKAGCSDSYHWEVRGSIPGGGDLFLARVLSSYTKVYSVIYDSGSVPRRAIFSPRETSPEVYTPQILGIGDVRWLATEDDIKKAYHKTSLK